MVEVDASQGKRDEGNRQDQTVGVHVFMEQREGRGAIIELLPMCLSLCYIHWGAGQDEQPRAYPRSTHSLYKHKRLVSLSLPIMGQTVLAE